MNIYQKLAEAQTKLVVKKDLDNKFAGFKYRSLETILAAIKPILESLGIYLFMSDKILFIDGRYYVEATATLVNAEKPEEQIIVTACAREVQEKKGSDPAQITGAASSYARKYALCGLFGIEGESDPDADDAPQTKAASKKQAAKIAVPEKEFQELKVYLKNQVAKGVDFDAVIALVTKRAAAKNWVLTNEQIQIMRAECLQ